MKPEIQNNRKGPLFLQIPTCNPVPLERPERVEGGGLEKKRHMRVREQQRKEWIMAPLANRGKGWTRRSKEYWLGPQNFARTPLRFSSCVEIWSLKKTLATNLPPVPPHDVFLPYHESLCVWRKLIVLFSVVSLFSSDSNIMRIYPLGL